MTKLLIASDCFLPRWDGVARFLLEIAPKLNEKFQTTIIAPHFKGQLKEEWMQGLELIRFPTYKFEIDDYPLPKANKKKIRDLIDKADIIFTQTIGPIGSAALKYARQMKKPVIAYIHSLEWELVSKGITKNELLRKLVSKIVLMYAKRLYNRCNMLLVPSKGIAETLMLKGIRTEKKIIHLGTNTIQFRPPANKEGIKNKLGLKNLIISFSGRLGKEKSIETLYNAFRKLKKKFHDISLILVAAGTKQERERLKDAKITGNVDNMQEWLQATDIYVMPSLTETTSLSTMEAMATGLPVIATRVGYIKDYIQDGLNGFFFPKKSSKRLGEVLEALILNPQLRHDVGVNARKTIQQHYSWELTAERIKNVLVKFS